MQEMYKAKINSPMTTLASDITIDQTTIPLVDASVLPDPPNICTIGTDDIAETIAYTGKDSNQLTGVTRGFQGVAKAWLATSPVGRYYTAYDHDTFVDNIQEIGSKVDNATTDLETHKAEKATQDKAGHIKLSDIPSPPVTSVAGRTGAVTLDKTDVGLSNVDNVKQLPISGGTMTGNLIANTGTDYTTKRARNIRFKTGGDFTTSELAVGEIGFIY